jgi:hypothetical protein
MRTVRLRYDGFEHRLPHSHHPPIIATSPLFTYGTLDSHADNASRETTASYTHNTKACEPSNIQIDLSASSALDTERQVNPSWASASPSGLPFH